MWERNLNVELRIGKNVSKCKVENMGEKKGRVFLIGDQWSLD